MSDGEDKSNDENNKEQTPKPEENPEKENNIENNNNNNVENNDINTNDNKIMITLSKAKTFQFLDKLRINITIIGKRKCGKSALIKSYLEKSFENDNIDTTLDIFGKKILLYGHEVSIIISEISQDKSNFNLAKEIITSSHIIFTCYSLEDDFQKKNDDPIEGSISLIEVVSKKIPIFLVGCKFDLSKEENIETNKILEEDGLTLNGKNIQDYINNKRENLGFNFCGYYVTSSLLNLNIQELFNDAIKTVASPFVKKYQKQLDEIPNDEEEVQIIEENKNKQQDNNIINNVPEKKMEIPVDENGCFIF